MFLREGKTYVYVVKDNKTEMRSVTPGIRGKDKLEISSGLEGGELVIIRGQERLSPGIDVKIANEPDSQNVQANLSSEKKTLPS